MIELFEVHENVGLRETPSRMERVKGKGGFEASEIIEVNGNWSQKLGCFSQGKFTEERISERMEKLLGLEEISVHLPGDGSGLYIKCRRIDVQARAEIFIFQP